MVQHINKSNQVYVRGCGKQLEKLLLENTCIWGCKPFQGGLIHPLSPCQQPSRMPLTAQVSQIETVLETTDLLLWFFIMKYFLKYQFAGMRLINRDLHSYGLPYIPFFPIFPPSKQPMHQPFTVSPLALILCDFQMLIQLFQT